LTLTLSGGPGIIRANSSQDLNGVSNGGNLSSRSLTSARGNKSGRGSSSGVPMSSHGGDGSCVDVESGAFINKMMSGSKLTSEHSLTTIEKVSSIVCVYADYYC
jgi:hypothetical protein